VGASKALRALSAPTIQSLCPNMNREEYELIAAGLIGETIVSVSYFEIAYENSKQMWSHDPEYDSLDYGLDLIMKSGKTKGIIWGSEFCQYGVSVNSDSLSTQLQGVQKINVSKNSRWQNLIGEEILNTKILWSWVKESGLFKSKVYYPQDLELSFSYNRKVYISALDIQEKKPTPMSDNLVVFFNREDARKYGVEA
jgi:hypothetical protein